MGMRITTNVTSINAQRTMVSTQRELQKSFAQLSSGSRITKAADDAAGLGISENLKSQIRSYNQASRNAYDGISLIQVAEGGLSEISNILTRLRELGIQAASDTVGDRERGYLDTEVKQLSQEVERIARTTRFGNTALLSGEKDQFDLQVGINNVPSEDRISFNSSALNATSTQLNLEALDFSQKEGAQGALSILDSAQAQVAGYRANLGALQNRLQSTVESLGVQYENLAAANSRIRDTDIAASTAEATRNNVLLQSSAAVLAQANQIPNIALKMIG